MLDEQLAALLFRFEVEDVERRIHEASQKRASRLENAVRFAPHRAHVVDEAVGDRMNDDIEACAFETAEVVHGAQLQANRQILAIGDELILGELLGRVVEDRHSIAVSSQEGTLLATAAGETKKLLAGGLGKPLERHRNRGA